ncbi:hypothetical protein BVG19_g5109 [[Candida] boidinii]|nr:hypothetical protein BVG19_g5109 [[Candida] boidinii]OWB50393.1 hypothetical protein B5S27_g1943 [[Candida] boidinii]OWB69009.1 hypothetical protein B5S30_g4405 [[Candida] boidinii]OWB83852.1 hypothetical protein B5S33_g2487 [[Candida] boidinii]
MVNKALDDNLQTMPFSQSIKPQLTSNITTATTAAAAKRLFMISRFLSTNGAPSSSQDNPTRSYPTLASLPKTQKFTAKLEPDPRIPSVEFARDPSTPKELFHKARQLKSGSFSWCPPEERKEYEFLLASDKALESLGLNPKTEPELESFQRIVSGQDATSKEYPFPYSQCYAGYQFGQFAGQLGDGRVVNLFEVENPETKEKFELQLKGSGKTPFSRFADGKAVLRSSIREFIISESLNSIGIPSTRALAITSLPKTYAQRYRAETCAVVCRMAKSFIRIGNFDLYRLRDDKKNLIKLCDFVIDEVFDGLDNFTFQNYLKDDSYSKILFDLNSKNELTKFDKMFIEICIKNSLTSAYWHAYGFLNGVLNTDNTSILGLSIDFGPFAFMDNFDPNFTSNHDDHELRYSFKNTPNAIWWNLVRLGEDLIELIGAGPKLVNDSNYLEVEGMNENNKGEIIKRAELILDGCAEIFEKLFLEKYLELMCKRIGIENPEQEDQVEIISPMLKMLTLTKLDYNEFFINLQNTKFKNFNSNDNNKIGKIFLPPNFKEEELSGYTKEFVIDEIKNWLPIYINRLNESAASGSISDEERLRVGSRVNPIFLPRNWILDEVIEFTETNGSNDISYLSKLSKMSSNPYDKSKWGDENKELEARWTTPADKEKQMLQCSCSS